MPRARARKRLAENWVNIVLTIISIIQGFVFTFLAGQFPNVYKYSINTGKYVVLALFVLSLLISLRIFQTYITAALDYEVEVPDFLELLLVVLVASIEFYLFSVFKDVPPPPPEGSYQSFDLNNFLLSFYTGGTIISLAGATGYLFALRGVWRRERLRFRKLGRPFEADEDYKSEVRLQRWNIAGMVAILIIHLFLLSSVRGYITLSYGLGETVHILCACAMIVILFANTIHSVRVTFPKDDQVSKPATKRAAPEGAQLEIDITKPELTDVTTLRDLLMQHFGYVYTTLFGNDERRTSRILESLLKANGGEHPLGYKSFYIAHPRNRRDEVVGVLMLKTGNRADRYGMLTTTLAVAKIVLRNLGVRGALRTWRRWQVIRGISPAVGPDELHVVYLAVSDGAMNRHVGRQLLGYARTIAKDRDKKFISLFVRAKNLKAQDFFRGQGFSVENTVTDAEADKLLGQGASIRMVAEI